MEPLSFWEKLQVLFSNMLAHPLFILLLLVPVFFILFNKKITKKFIIAFYLLVIAIVLFIGNTTLFELFDNMMDNIFMTLYFPNFVTLFIVEVASAVITLITFLRPNIQKVNKIINVVGFGIIQTLFCLVLTVIQVNNIDIYKENALYGSNDVLTLMQLLMGAFALQLLTMVIVHVIEKITKRLDERESETIKTSINKQVEQLKETKVVPEKEIKIPEKVITIVKEKPVIQEKVITVVKEKPVEPFKTEPVKPLDHSLINESKIKPIDLKKEIDKEKVFEPVKKQEEKLKEIKPLDLNQEVMLEKIKPSNLEEPLKEKTPKPDLLKPMETFKEENIPKKMLEKPVEPINFKPEFPNNKEVQVTSPPVNLKQPEKILEKPVEPINFKPEFPNNKAVQVHPKAVLQKEEAPAEQIIEKAPLAAGLMMHKPGQEETWIAAPEKPALTVYEINPMFKAEKEIINTEKELVTNLNIIDFDKTIKLVNNVKKIYTL